MSKILLCTALLSGSLLAAEPTTHILIAYYSQTGNTERMARDLSEGAMTVAGTDVTLKKIAEVKGEDIKNANGVLVGSPVHMHNISIEALQFLGRLGPGDGRTAGVFCTAGHSSLGKEMARLEAIATLLEMRFVIIGGVEEGGFGNLGPEATTGDANHPTLNDTDLANARRSGERFARLTKQFQAK